MNKDMLSRVCAENWYVRAIDESYLYCVGNAFSDVEYIILKSFAGFAVYVYNNGELIEFRYIGNDDKLLKFIKEIE